MKAALFDKYKSLESLHIAEIERPKLKKNEVLVNVKASSINSWDLDILYGIPLANRVDFGLFKPKRKIIGCDIAGSVVEVGSDVQNIKIGQNVFADLSSSDMGAFAEFAKVPEEKLAIMPDGMTYVEAASFPHTGVLAIQGLRYKGSELGNMKVLINGAGGGAGTFALQQAKFLNAEVTCVDKKNKFDLLKSLGADHVVDYHKEDFTKNGKTYDLILDVVTHRTVLDYIGSLSSKGIYVMLGGGSYNRVFQFILMLPFISLWNKLKDGKAAKKLSLLMHKPNKADLNYISELYKSGAVKPIIDRIYSFDDIRKAFLFYSTGETIGKVVIRY